MTNPQQPVAREELERLARAQDASALDDFVESLSPGETSHALEQMSNEECASVLRVLETGDAADLIERIPEQQAADLLRTVEPAEAAAIVDELPSDEQADLLGELDDSVADEILERMSDEDAADARLLRQYADDVAGGLMVREFVSYPTTATVREVKADLAERGDEYESYDIQYTYATAPDGRLAGVIPVRRLLFGRSDQSLGDLMIAPVLSVLDHASLDQLREFFVRHHFFGVPIVGLDGRLVGVVQRAAVEAAASERAEVDLLHSQGLLEEELRSMPLRRRASRRLAWLSVNVLLNCAAAAVIASYESTLSAVIALAVFLPMISDMSGCCGSQAIAVSLRELTLGLHRKGYLVYVLGKEAAIGVVNGLVLGLLMGLIAWLWIGSPWLGVVVGGAMAVNAVVAVSIGGCVPVVLRALRCDPALASGPILTTVTDLCGFFFALSFATALLSRLVESV